MDQGDEIETPTVEDVDSELSDMFWTQQAVQMAILEYTMASNLQHALHTNKKSMMEKIGQS